MIQEGKTPNKRWLLRQLPQRVSLIPQEVLGNGVINISEFPWPRARKPVYFFLSTWQTRMLCVNSRCFWPTVPASKVGSAVRGQLFDKDAGPGCWESCWGAPIW